jgi:type II secretory ATPase GspE/PulE/Tfp pilus assembly ATPase PilB-like protein
LEDVVMRILAAGEPIPLEKMGFTEHNLEELKKIISKPYGLFFVCGPTGSGKTTTLHSVLKYLNRDDTKIWTAEDPVEITQRGLRQVQINVKAGLTFPAIMRSFLRADPDIIMVGEMRDKETTSIGIEASLTGHLVLATLHTNSAPESVIRLLDMGMDPFNFSDALLGVLAQRLAKRLCKNCKESYVASEYEVDTLLAEYCAELKNIDRFKADPDAALREIREQYGEDQGQITLYKAAGCDNCVGTGYSGRVGLHELRPLQNATNFTFQSNFGLICEEIGYL